jgi:hypothetical protein
MPAIPNKQILESTLLVARHRVELQHEQRNAKKTVKIVGADAAYAFGPWNSTFGRNGSGWTIGMWQLSERRADGWKISA